MNIFFLDMNPAKAAEYHCDKHVIKMILEGCQLMSTAHRMLDGVVHVAGEYSDDSMRGLKGVLLLKGESIKFRPEGGYNIQDQKCCALSHQNHPMAIWVRASAHNYTWQHELTKRLAAEHLLRYHEGNPDKLHKTFKMYGNFLWDVPKNIPDLGFTEPPQCMPDEYKVPGDLVQAYRNYYNGGKTAIAKWKNRKQPEWYTGA